MPNSENQQRVDCGTIRRNFFAFYPLLTFRIRQFTFTRIRRVSRTYSKRNQHILEYESVLYMHANVYNFYVRLRSIRIAITQPIVHFARTCRSLCSLLVYVQSYTHLGLQVIDIVLGWYCPYLSTEALNPDFGKR